MLKSKQEIREKKKQIAEKLKVRVVGKTPEKKKRGPTGELELFKKIAEEQRDGDFVNALHMNFDGEVVVKRIRMEDLTPENFHHECPKSRGEEYRLDPNNIEIVSTAWHHYEHTRQILQTDLPN